MAKGLQAKTSADRADFTKQVADAKQKATIAHITQPAVDAAASI
jgi:hypothetical protein